MTSTPRKRVGILISGRGSNMRALVEAARDPTFPAEVAVVISNRPQAAGLAWAREQGLPTEIIDHKHYAERSTFDAELDRCLASAGVELVCCAGFMRLMTALLVQKWEGRMLNIHPSLLPLFRGLDPQKQALEAGVRISGCTVHYVVPEMDAGPIVAQAAVQVDPDDTPDTLAARILEAEHRLYPHAVRLVASGDVRLEQGRVRICAGPPSSSPLYSPPF
jgi:phosphoribosylglycinamide formyltransferase-1